MPLRDDTIEDRLSGQHAQVGALVRVRLTPWTDPSLADPEEVGWSVPAVVLSRVMIPSDAIVDDDSGVAVPSGDDAWPALELLMTDSRNQVLKFSGRRCRVLLSAEGDET